MVLATVVQTFGSTYRKPGARLLVLADGLTLGLVNGGCLEDEVAVRVRPVFESGAPMRLSFDTPVLDGLRQQH